MDETVGEAVCSITEGIRSAPAVADLNGDGYPDLLVGNYAGGLSLFMGAVPPPLAIAELRLPSQTLKVYPNPTEGTVTVVLPPAHCNLSPEIRVFDIFGKLLSVVETCHGASIQIDLSHYASGIYFVNVYQGQHILHSSKVVKIAP